MKGVVQELANGDLEHRREGLRSLHGLAKVSSTVLPLPHLSELLRQLAACLYDADREVSQLTLEIVEEVFNVKTPQKASEDLDVEHSGLLPGLLHKTTDPRFSSLTLSCILSYSKYSRSPSIVLSELYFQGLRHEDVSNLHSRV